MTSDIMHVVYTEMYNNFLMARYKKPTTCCTNSKSKYSALHILIIPTKAILHDHMRCILCACYVTDVTYLCLTGQVISIRWTISNNGIGVTASNQWHDRIFWSEDEQLGRFILVHSYSSENYFCSSFQYVYLLLD